MPVYDNPSGCLPIISCGVRTIQLYKRVSGNTFKPETIVRVIVGNTLIDECDYPNLSQHIWNMYVGRKSYYAVRKKIVNGMTVNIRLAREVMGLPHSRGPGGLEADHINGMTLENTRDNLRVASRSQNSANIRQPRVSIRFRGVRRGRNGVGFQSYIAYQGKSVWFPTLRSEIEAGLLAFYAGTILHQEFYCQVGDFPPDEMPSEARQEFLWRLVCKKLIALGLMPNS